jgi:transcriptional regulator with GAF, ATPase, and Fis domain
MPKIWYHFFDGRPASADEIIKSLRDDGLEIGELSSSAPKGPGILFFNSVTPQLHDFVYEISRNSIERVLAITSAHSVLSNSDTWSLLQSGLSHILKWDQSENIAGCISDYFERWNMIDDLLESPLIQDHIIGRSPVWIAKLRQIVEVARFTDASILIMGESGTGKELAARLIHDIDSQRQNNNFVILDCTTVVPELSGSEFFGHERGAFTGAITTRDGAFALANGGTLFLDEVGDLPLKLQAQLLRVIQERTYKRVGGNTWYNTDFRLICATNKDLIKEVNQGSFRSDLYYRITNWSCKLPSLNERREDILLLAGHFIKQLMKNGGQPEIEPSVMEYLLCRAYQGNVRDLKQLVSRIMYRYVGKGPITAGDIPDEERPRGEVNRMSWCDEGFEKAIRNALLYNASLKEIRRISENMAIRIALGEENGNLQRAAKRLGITDRALQIRRATERQSKQITHINTVNEFIDELL